MSDGKSRNCQTVYSTSQKQIEFVHRYLLCLCLQNDLKLANEIKMFKLGAELDDYCIVFTSDYKDHVVKVMAELSISKNVCSKSISY
jgi:hypothetical protein